MVLRDLLLITGVWNFWILMMWGLFSFVMLGSLWALSHWRVVVLILGYLEGIFLGNLLPLTFLYSSGVYNLLNDELKCFRFFHLISFFIFPQEYFFPLFSLLGYLEGFYGFLHFLCFFWGFIFFLIFLLHFIPFCQKQTPWSKVGPFKIQ